MPEFSIDHDELKVTLEFEAYCATCKTGICDHVEADETRRRKMPCIQITPCEMCMERATQEGRDEKEDEIEKLRERIAELEDEKQADTDAAPSAQPEQEDAHG